MKGKANAGDQTLPLVDLEEFEAHPRLYKKLLVSEPKVKFNTVSKTNFAKPSSSQTITKPMGNFSFAKPVARSGIKPPNAPKILKEPPTSVSKIPQPGRKLELSKHDQILQEILKHVKKLSEKMDSIEGRLNNLQTMVDSQLLHYKCSCNNKTNDISKKTDEMTKNGNMEDVKKCLFDTVSSVAKESEKKESVKTVIENNYIINDVKDSFSNNDLLIIENDLNPSKDSTAKNDNNSDIINSLQQRQIDHDLLKTKKDEVTEKQYNNLGESSSKTNTKVTVTVEEFKEFQNDLKLIDKIHNKIWTDEITKMRKESAATSKFELLEQQIKYGLLNDSISISSDPNSPFVEMEIEKLISNNLLEDDVFKTVTHTNKNPDQTQSESASNHQVNTPTDKLSEMEKTYNKLNENVKFLCTPLVKRTVTVVTSTKLPNSHKKIVSRRIQEQLFLLDDF